MRAIIAAALFAITAHSATAQSITRHPPVTTLQIAGTTSAAVGTFTVALDADNGTRTGCSVTNTSSGGTLFVFVRGPLRPVGTTAAAIPLLPGATYRCFDAEQGEISLAASIPSATYILQSE